MSLSAEYVSFVGAIASETGGSHALAHVHAGLAIFVAVQFLMRDRRASLNALIWVAGAGLANEVIQAAHYGSPRWADTLGDIALTLLWPTILYVLGKYRRQGWRFSDAGRFRFTREKPLLPVLGAGGRAPPFRVLTRVSRRAVQS